MEQAHALGMGSPRSGSPAPIHIPSTASSILFSAPGGVDRHTGSDPPGLPGSPKRHTQMQQQAQDSARGAETASDGGWADADAWEPATVHVPGASGSRPGGVSPLTQHVPVIARDPRDAATPRTNSGQARQAMGATMPMPRRQSQQHEPLEAALEEGYRWVQEGGLRRIIDRAPVRIPGLSGGGSASMGQEGLRSEADRREAAGAYELEEGLGMDRGDERARRQD